MGFFKNKRKKEEEAKLEASYSQGERIVGETALAEEMAADQQAAEEAAKGAEKTETEERAAVRQVAAAGEAEEPKETEILLESWSPICNIQAFVEDNGTCVYFYLWLYPTTDYARMKTCWVCNRKPASAQLDSAAMQEGMAPMMPSPFVAHDAEGISLDPEKLSVVWFEEGDAAALLEDGTILAVIPGWSGEGFSGYARYAKGQGPYAWELAQAEPVLKERTDRSEAYWNRMDGDYWPEVQQTMLADLERFFGPHDKYFAIDGGNFPPKALVTGARNGVQYGITIGVSALVQPVIEQYYQEETPLFRRIELGFACEDGAMSDKEYMALLSYLSGQTQLPWGEIAWLGHGHTIPCNALPGYPAVLLLNDNLLDGVNSPALAPVMEERVNLLWLLPLTEEEYELARSVELPELLKRSSGPAERINVFTGKPKFSA